ncbi:unnamed protein product [Rotaria sordida]|uniref:Uncharacterized protein n=1 Tax=Rotaria sordida TaxID=392033 RepID=A0A819T4X3_9BILA|nr:unnamed protein product [Rotaria sordida]
MTNPLISTAVLLANSYKSLDEIDKASDISIHLHKSNAKKKISLSWTAVNRQIFQFRAHNQSHSRSIEISAELEKISKKVIEYDYEYDSNWIRQSLNLNEIVASVLCEHS